MAIPEQHQQILDFEKRRKEDGERCLEAALYYANLGWSVLALCPPSHSGMAAVDPKHSKTCQSPGKRPWHRWKHHEEVAATPDEIRAYWKKMPWSNVGLALGPASLLVRIDVEGTAGEALLQEKSKGDLPRTLEFRSGRKDGTGRGLLYRLLPGCRLRTTIHDAGVKSELRLQAKGAQTVLPPSRHIDGGLYEWLPGQSPWDMEAALAPPWLLEELKEDTQPGNPFSSNGKPRKTPQEWSEKMTGVAEGCRDTSATEVVGRFLALARELSDGTVALARDMMVLWNEQNEPPLDEEQLLKVFHSILGKETEKRRQMDLRRIVEFDSKAAEDVQNSKPNGTSPPAWHLIIVGADAPTFLLRCPYWSELPQTQKTNGYISLTVEQVFNWSGKQGSKNNVRFQAYLQAQANIPMHKNWNSAGGILDQLTTRAERRTAPPESQRSLYILGFIWRFCQKAQVMKEEGKWPEGKLVSDGAGTVYFKFEALQAQIDFCHEDFTRLEVSALLDQHAAPCWPDPKRTRWWKIEANHIKELGRITGQIAND
jgi:Bifunctional DNA primase/polymerase, N-terminal